MALQNTSQYLTYKLAHKEMKILWFNWRCIKHPLAGGAEVYTHEIARRLASDGHEVILVTSRPKNSPKEEYIDGYRVIRSGGKYTVYLQARKIYNQLKKEGWKPDIVIDEVNTIPFFTVYYVEEPIVMLIHQLCMECWDYAYKFPLNKLGRFIEKEVHKIYSKMAHKGKIKHIITVSPSTKEDLIKLGYPEDKISIVYNGIDIDEEIDCEELIKKKENIVLYLGRITPYKRIEDILYAWQYIKKEVKDAKLIIAGRADPKYLKKLYHITEKLNLKDVEFKLNITEEEKKQLYKISKVNVITSVREGWGRTVIEAGIYCTPTIAYKTPGIKDAIKHRETGLLIQQQNPMNLAEILITILKQKELWRILSQNTQKENISFTWPGTYTKIKGILKSLT